MKSVQSETSQRTVKAKQPPAQRKYLSLAVDVAGLPCLIVGGGHVGTRKALTLARSGAQITVLSPEVSDRLQRLIDERSARWIQSEYDADHLNGFTLVVAATSDPALNLAISRDAEERHILHACVSPGRASRVIFPATCVVRQEVTVAVHSNGRDCSESKAVRDEIARTLLRNERRPAELTVFGARREELPADVWNALAPYADRDNLTLATCRRWEVYALARSPRAFGADLRRRLHEQAGVLVERHREAFYTKQGVAAYHHLLRVATGLDSPVRGETEIVGQVRQALARAPKGEEAAAAAVISALTAQRSIRSESGLAARAANWAEVAVTLLKGRLGQLQGRCMLVVGCGRLGRDISTQLVKEGATVLPFSRRARSGGVEWCAQLGLAVREPLDLPAFLLGADVLALTTELSEALGGALAERLAHSDTPLVLDLAGSNHAGLRRRANYIGLGDIRLTPQTGEEAAQIAIAEKLAVNQALLWHVQQRPAQDAPSILRIGSRASWLAQEQVSEISEFLRILLPQTALNLVTFQTPGDLDKRTPLPQVTQEDFFTSDLDQALLRGEIDLAVHSAKDLPNRILDGLHVVALTPSVATWEALVLRKGVASTVLPAGARVGTSSARRAQRLLELYPEAIVADVRGNVPERVAQLDAGRYDALILAAAGLVRLGLQGRISQIFSAEQFPSEPGQGSLAVVVRDTDSRLRELLQPLNLGERKGLPWA